MLLTKKTRFWQNVFEIDEPSILKISEKEFNFVGI